MLLEPHVIGLMKPSGGGGEYAELIRRICATSVGSFGIQLPITIRPPGRVTRTISFATSNGRGANIAPKMLTTRSKRSSSMPAKSDASPSWNRQFVEAETLRRFPASTTRSLAVRRAGDGLALMLAELEPATQAAALRLDPVADREEYAELVALTDGGEALSLERLEQVESEGGAARRLIGRAKNLGLHRWGIWAGTERSSILPELGQDDVRCLVVDLGSLATREEQALASAAVLGELWRRREERRPMMIVIDEAHNVCPARPEDPLTAIATEYAVRIAGEGRKFGLYLLVSTQRPQKVHENVLSQCDNLLLMRMNSLADLGFVSEVFSFVPQSLLEQATTFQQGESLAAGLVAPHPAFVRFGRRLAREGGGDVAADWSRPLR